MVIITMAPADGREDLPPRELSWDDPVCETAFFGRPLVTEDELEAVNSGGATQVAFRVKETQVMVG